MTIAAISALRFGQTALPVTKMAAKSSTGETKAIESVPAPGSSADNPSAESNFPQVLTGGVTILVLIGMGVYASRVKTVGQTKLHRQDWLRPSHWPGANWVSAKNHSRENYAGQTLPEFNGAGQIFHKANFRGADLAGADFRGADLSGADLSGANLTGAKLNGANLYYANLSGADLTQANLNNTKLHFTNLQQSTLTNVYAEGSDWRGANLTGARCEHIRKGSFWMAAMYRKPGAYQSTIPDYVFGRLLDKELTR
ncbi:MAG: pentapeptide repeat-containing protein [Candidatus Melainabacteria bacterium]|nr:pentapeptide repeat-containing protein [Candidatus Melainabacteria bacterium]